MSFSTSASRTLCSSASPVSSIAYDHGMTRRRNRRRRLGGRSNDSGRRRTSCGLAYVFVRGHRQSCCVERSRLPESATGGLGRRIADALTISSLAPSCHSSCTATACSTGWYPHLLVPLAHLRALNGTDRIVHLSGGPFSPIHPWFHTNHVSRLADVGAFPAVTPSEAYRTIKARSQVPYDIAPEIAGRSSTSTTERRISR